MFKGRASLRTIAIVLFLSALATGGRSASAAQAAQAAPVPAHGGGPVPPLRPPPDVGRVPLPPLKVLRKLVGEAPRACTYGPDGRRLFGLDSDALNAWDLPGGKLAFRREIERPENRRVQPGLSFGAMRLSPDGSRVLVAVEQPAVRLERAFYSDFLLYDAKTGGKLPAPRPLPPVNEFPDAFGFTAEGRPLVYYADGEGVRRSVFELDGGKRFTGGPVHDEFLAEGTGPGHHLDRSTSGRWLARRSGGLLKVLDTTNGQLRTIVFPDDGNGIALESLTFSPDDRYAALADKWGKLILVDLHAGEIIRVIPSEARQSQVTTLAFSPDGRFLTWVDGDGIARVTAWAEGSAEQPAPVRAFLSGAQGCLAIAPDGKSLALGTAKGIQIVDGAGILTPRPKSKGLGDDALVALYARLGGPARQAVDAVNALIPEGGAAVAVLKGRLPLAPYRPADAATVRKLVTDLGDKRFPVRARAQETLKKLGRAEAEAEGPGITPAKDAPRPVQTLLEEATRSVDPEVSHRAAALLRMTREGALTPSTLTQLRSIEILEAIGGADARTLLERLGSADYPGGFVPRAAAAARARLEARTRQGR